MTTVCRVWINKYIWISLFLCSSRALRSAFCCQQARPPAFDQHSIPMRWAFNQVSNSVARRRFRTVRQLRSVIAPPHAFNIGAQVVRGEGSGARPLPFITLDQHASSS